MKISTYLLCLLADAKAEGSQELSGALIGALIVGLLTGLVPTIITFVNNRGDKRERLDSWIRDRLFECYSNGLYYLVKLDISSSNPATPVNQVQQHFSEVQRFLNLLRGYHASSTAIQTTLQNHTAAIAAAWGNMQNLSAPAQAALADVKLLFQNDHRVQV